MRQEIKNQINLALLDGARNSIKSLDLDGSEVEEIIELMDGLQEMIKEKPSEEG